MWRIIRMSMFELAQYHAAARGARVILRGENTLLFTREAGEGSDAFLRRLRERIGAEPLTEVALRDDESVLAILFRGDLELPRGATCYALFHEQSAASIAASDLIA